MNKGLRSLIVLIIVMLISTMNCVFAEEMDISVILDGKKIMYDVKPFVENQTVLVPVRKTLEAFGMNVVWNDLSKTAIITGKGKSIVLELNSEEAIVMDKKVLLAAPPKSVNGSMLIPLRFMAESLGWNVQWIQETKTVKINSLTASNEPYIKPVILPRPPEDDEADSKSETGVSGEVYGE